PPSPALLVLTVLTGIAGITSSTGIYLIPARPAWNTWRTPVQFFLTAVLLGSASGLVVLCASGLAGAPVEPAGGPTAVGSCLAAAAGACACGQAVLPWSLAAAGFGGGDAPVRAAAVLLTRHFPRLLWMRTLLLPASALLFAAAAARGPGAAGASFSAAG